MNAAATITAMLCLWNGHKIKHEKDIRHVYSVISKAQKVSPVPKDEALALWTGAIITGNADSLNRKKLPAVWVNARNRLVQQSLV